MLDKLRRIVQEVNEAENLPAALRVIVTNVKAVMKTDVCSIYLIDPDNQQRVLMATEGLNPESVGKARLGEGEGLVSLVLERAEPINLENASEHPRYKYLPETAEERFHSFLGVPIVHHRKPMGTLVVQQLDSRTFDEEEVTLLMTIAAQLAGAIAHAEASGGISGLKGTRHRDRPFRGLPGAPGVGIGLGVVVYPTADLNAVPNRRTDDVNGEVQAFRAAVVATIEELEAQKKRIEHLPAESKLLFDAYLLMLTGDSLVKKTIDRIKEGYWASTALRDIVHAHVQQFEAMDDAYLAERARDIRDLGTRILVHLQSKTRGPRQYPKKTVLVGDALTASDLVEVPPEQLIGVISTQGSGSSHVAILARALGVPTVMGAADMRVTRSEGCTLVVDGYQGVVYVDPTKGVISEYNRLLKEEQELSAGLETLKDEPAITPDGVRIPLYINSGLLSDVNSSTNSGAEGIGLYRTEFPFMIRDRFPGEEEQATLYRQVLNSFDPRPVTLRTLDIGGDKTLSYFPITEENPFLGWRGIRISLDHPDIFVTQLRALLRASAGKDNLHILLPMITSVSEVNESLELIKRARYELIDEGLVDIKMPRIGAMIEVPSSVYQAAIIAKRVDFLSIGTNDLVQYLLAVDRNNPNVAELYDCLHPAVISAVQTVVRAAARARVPVSVCGEMAGDPAAVILLLGMGMDSLSMSVVALPRIKWVIRSITYQRARELLEQALTMEDSQSIRSMLNREIEDLGMGGLLRAGK
ncbi:MAG: phosphoenolpyruvate--protein phosphotransferase [Gammaproteobacteria bacterium]|nr:phosphoenolpyruvate--protein phosphotransferase [Gammaproteobacteria bacterium]MDH5693970.1 phosphoenolpyruvate--protein phosphotransferase [Gammaproteobacteria bacterium]